MQMNRFVNGTLSFSSRKNQTMKHLTTQSTILIFAFLFILVPNAFSGEILAPESPCELVSVDEIRTVCEVDGNVEIEKLDRDYTHATCTFKWEDKRVSKVMNVGGNEMTIDMPSEVMIVMVPEATEAMYDQSIKVYKDGVEVELAEKAIWGSDMSQLSFLSNGILFHVNVKVSNDEAYNKQKAVEIAEILIIQ
jgi:hypothetical protein